MGHPTRNTWIRSNQSLHLKQRQHLSCMSQTLSSSCMSGVPCNSPNLSQLLILDQEQRVPITDGAVAARTRPELKRTISHRVTTWSKYRQRGKRINRHSRNNYLVLRSLEIRSRSYSVASGNRQLSRLTKVEDCLMIYHTKAQLCCSLCSTLNSKVASNPA